ncbi:hypothetical protein [Sphingomonas sp. LaA6.9]|uniref:hypothetical protein n=1 Tax=Sphingomonas sp. LaA6.9 TaxID=2919914 RepID=UPI001F4F9953|nr:hypothetical protein [Sphingomonas sp. LaA6.9]MCJ8157726.1 hypothetical protein [Sphingomonas sp. LaA6.9]
MRRAAAIALLGIGLYCAMVSLLGGFGRGSVEHTVEHSKQIAAQFRTTAAFVREYHQQHGRLPTDEELLTWSEDQPQHQGTYLIVEPGVGQFGEEAVAQLGRLQKDAYFIGMWRGEWMEYYAPTSGRTTLRFDEGDYYVLGSRNRDMFLGGLLMLAALASSIGLWTGRLIRPQPFTSN